jgi:hypothetical protein
MTEWPNNGTRDEVTTERGNESRGNDGKLKRGNDGPREQKTRERRNNVTTKRLILPLPFSKTWIGGYANCGNTIPSNVFCEENPTNSRQWPPMGPRRPWPLVPDLYPHRSDALADVYGYKHWFPFGRRKWFDFLSGCPPLRSLPAGWGVLHRAEEFMCKLGVKSLFPTLQTEVMAVYTAG